tara:strand:+ start:75016 stop:76017 length:1002 start_codon:yes stop_codon:yes gene_type:complete
MQTASYYVEESTPVRARTRMSWPASLFWLAVFMGVGGYGIYAKDALIAIIPIVVMFSAFSGFRLGALRLTGSIAAIALAIAYAPQLGVAYEVRFSQWFGTTGLTNRFASIGAIGVLISLFVTVAFIVLTSRMVSRRPGLAWLNSWFGFFFAAAQGGLAVLLLLGGVLMIEPMEQRNAEAGVTKSPRGQMISDAVLTVAEHTHSSQIGPYIERFNPFVKIPQLNKLDQVQQTVRVLNNPTEMNQLLNHPQVIELKKRPETKRAVRELMEDPTIREILASKNRMDKSTAMTLMSHPAILNLIDQPGFLEAATEVITSRNGKGTSVGHMTANPLIH